MRRALSWRIAIDSLFLLIGSYVIGTHVLAFFGISLPVVQVSGGLVVIPAGWTILKQPDESRTPRRRHRNMPAAGPIPPSVLSADAASDSGSGVDFRGDHVGCKRGAPPPTRNRLPGDFGCADWVGAARAEHLCVTALRTRSVQISDDQDSSDHRLSAFLLVASASKMYGTEISALLSSLPRLSARRRDARI